MAASGVRCGVSRAECAPNFGGLSKMRGVTTTIAATLLGLAVAAQPATAAGYDGDWTVSVTTDHGTCERSSNYDVHVVHGNIIYTSYTAVSLYGRVSPDGAVSVLLTRLDDSARGTGRLSQSTGSGSGSWRGAGKDGACSGHWDARRR